LEEINDTLFGFLFLIYHVLMESFLLATFGITPGKALLRTRVRRANGERLGYLEALRRTILVAIVGLGAGIPVVSLATSIVAYRRLTKTGATFWDDSGGFTVSHETIGVVRVFVAVSIIVAFLGLILYAAIDQ